MHKEWNKTCTRRRNMNIGQGSSYWWTSLAVQWLGVHLPMQGAQVRSPVQEDSPSCRGATRLVHTTTEASTPRACAQQQVKSLQ